MNTKKQNKKGVFGLTSVQQFFVIVLGVALLAYVIVIIMGTLTSSNILTQTTGIAINETVDIVVAGDTLDLSLNTSGFGSPAITLALNGSDLITSGNYTIVGNIVYNKSAVVWENALVTYTFNKDTQSQINSKNLLVNTSNGVAGFFGSINPVYAILAILVIILVLVVLVRVVSGGNTGGMGSGSRSAEVI